MTLTFDPLTLNFCGRSGVMCSNSVRNLSEIGQSAAKLLKFEYLTFMTLNMYHMLRYGIVCTKLNSVKLPIHEM